MADSRSLAEQFPLHHVIVHGHQRAYRKAGSGPALLLLHGLGLDSTTWLPILPALSERYTVIAPDLLGHGDSAKPRADYSIGGYANGMRDLLTVLGVDKVTVVGHSFGGGVAMQFAYQFPERTERLCLVAPGGFGREVTPLLKALTLPGAGIVLAGLSSWPIRTVIGHTLSAARRTGLPHTADLGDAAQVYRALCKPDSRAAVRHVLRAAVDWRGQVITMTDRAYLTRLMPMLVVWGADDDVVPVAHAEIAARCAPDAHVHVIAGCGHFPHKNNPEVFVEVLDTFIASTKPASYHRRQWRALLRGGGAEPAVRSAATA